LSATFAPARLTPTPVPPPGSVSRSVTSPPSCRCSVASETRTERRPTRECQWSDAPTTSTLDDGNRTTGLSVAVAYFGSWRVLLCVGESDTYPSIRRDGPTSTGRCSVRRSVRDSHRRALLGQFSKVLAGQNDADLSPRRAVYQRWSAPAPTPVIPAGGVARRRSLPCWTPNNQSQWRSFASSNDSAILALATSGSSWSQAAQADPSSDSSSSVSRCWVGSSI